jgi:pimeloyl-ACP methyl ester carboxylesterase
MQITVPGIGAVELTVTERGAGHPILLLHGGGGPLTVNPWADRLAGAEHARVLTPVHPGFNGTPRPAALDSMAVLSSPRVSSYVLVDAVGIEVPGHPVADFFSLTMAEVAELSYHDPATYGIDPAKLPPQAQAAMAGNRVALKVYSGDGMGDPALAGRLGGVTAPALVVWGEADRIGDPDFGRAYAAAIPGAEFTLIPDSGHLPQIETPDALIKVVWEFADAHATAKP